MNLNSTQDMLLLRNCIVIKIYELKFKINQKNSNFFAIQQSLDCYTEILDNLNNNKIENVLDLLHNSDENSEIKKFANHIAESSPQIIAQEYLNLTKEIMKFHNVYSDEKFKELKKAFYKENENLSSYSTNFDNFEEEPENSTVTNYSNEEIEESLHTLNSLFKSHIPQKMSTSDFKMFLFDFKTIVKKLGMEKFQQYFDETSQLITDMSISYDTDSISKPIYKTDIRLLDSSSQESHVSVHVNATQSGFTSTYYQNLCYSYLEADKYWNLDSNLISPNLIETKMKDFLECFKNIEAMMKTCKINISDNTIVCSAVTEYIPELSIEACNTYPENDGMEL